jgi:hypothetical protein
MIAEQDRLAQLAALRIAHETHRHDEDAEAAGGQQIEAAPHEVGHRRLLAVVAVAVLERRLAPLAKGRVADGEVDLPDRLVPVLRDPALKGPREHGQARAHGGQQGGGQRRVFDRRPPDRRGAQRIEGEDEAADARGGLDRPDHAVEADQIREQRPRDPGDLGHEGARGVILVDQAAGVDLQRRRERGLRLVDREAAPPAVSREHAAILDRERPGGLAHQQLHGLEVGGRAPRFGPGVGLPGSIGGSRCASISVRPRRMVRRLRAMKSSSAASEGTGMPRRRASCSRPRTRATCRSKRSSAACETITPHPPSRRP